MFNTILKLLKYKSKKTKKGLWVFTSFNGHYSDNPKYISQKLHDIDPSKEIIWLVKKDYLSLLPEYVKGLEIHTKQADNAKGAAEVIIDNVYGEKEYALFDRSIKSKFKSIIYRFLINKKKQTVYTTWHGTPLKRMGRDQLGNTVFDFYCPNTIMILGNQFTLDIMKHLTFEKIPMKLLGTPRNDILFGNNNKTLKEKLELPIDKKIVLFAPTFRNDGKDTEGKNVLRSGVNQLNEIDFNKLFRTLNEKFGGEWVFVCRFHYHVESLVNWDELNHKYEGKFINGNLHDDMAEYLACTDILITDASSCMFDYALTEKPCMLYFPDLENYKGKERGFYLDINELPFPVAKDNETLISNIESFDSENYKMKVKEMLERFGHIDDENSSERIVKYILEETK